MSSRESLIENTSEDERELEKLKTELSDSAESEIIAKQVDEHFLEVLDKQIRSAPSSPRSGDTAFSLVKFRVASFENLVIYQFLNKKYLSKMEKIPESLILVRYIQNFLYFLDICL